MDEIVRKGLLYDRYGALLNDHQREVYEASVYHDLSLAEIAETTGMTRQGVSDMLKRTTAVLDNYEDKLGVLAKEESVSRALEDLEEALLKEENNPDKPGADRKDSGSLQKQIRKSIKTIRRSMNL